MGIAQMPRDSAAFAGEQAPALEQASHIIADRIAQRALQQISRSVAVRLTLEEWRAVESECKSAAVWGLFCLHDKTQEQLAAEIVAG